MMFFYRGLGGAGGTSSSGSGFCSMRLSISHADGEPLPFRMFLQVGKETRDDNRGALDDMAQAGAGTTVAIVTPDGDESDAEDPPVPVSLPRGVMAF